MLVLFYQHTLNYYKLSLFNFNLNFNFNDNLNVNDNFNVNRKDNLNYELHKGYAAL